MSTPGRPFRITLLDALRQDSFYEFCHGVFEYKAHSPHWQMCGSTTLRAFSEFDAIKPENVDGVIGWFPDPEAARKLEEEKAAARRAQEEEEAAARRAQDERALEKIRETAKKPLPSFKDLMKKKGTAPPAAATPPDHHQARQISTTVQRDRFRGKDNETHRHQ